MNRIVRRLSLGIPVSVFGCGTAWGQATAQISGTVRDQSGAVLPGVEISTTQMETGINRRTITNETGSYTLPNLTTGPRRLEASLPGFRTFVQTGILLEAQSVWRHDRRTDCPEQAFFLCRPDTNLRQGTFGQIRSSASPRILQFALKYVF